MVPKVQTASEFLSMKKKDQKRVFRHIVKEANKMQRDLSDRVAQKREENKVF